MSPSLNLILEFDTSVKEKHNVLLYIHMATDWYNSHGSDSFAEMRHMAWAAQVLLQFSVQSIFQQLHPPTHR